MAEFLLSHLLQFCECITDARAGLIFDSRFTYLIDCCAGAK